MISIKLRKEMDEISSYLDILKNNLVNITSSQLKVLEECIEQEINAASDMEELSYITDLVYNSLKDVMTNSKIGINSSIEYNKNNIDTSNLSSDTNKGMEDFAIKAALDEDKIIPNETDISPLSKLFTIDSLGNKIYKDSNLEIDPQEKAVDSVYVVDLNKLKNEEDSIVSSSNLDIPENLNSVNNDVKNTNNDEPVILDNEKKDDLATNLSSIEYSQNVIKNQVDDIKENLAIPTPKIDNLESLMANTQTQSDIDPLAELANAKVEPSILDENNIK